MRRIVRMGNSVLVFGLVVLFALPIVATPVGPISGVGVADVVVAFGGVAQGLPPSWVGWVILVSYFVLACSLVITVWWEALALVMSGVALVICLVTLLIQRSSDAGFGLWIVLVLPILCALLVGSLVWRWPVEVSIRFRSFSGVLGTIAVAVAIIAIWEDSDRRSTGAKSPERAAEMMVKAAFNNDSYAAISVLDPEEISHAQASFHGMKGRLGLLSQLKEVLGGFDEPHELNDVPDRLITQTKAGQDGDVELKIVGLKIVGLGTAPHAQPPETTVPNDRNNGAAGMIVTKLGVDKRPTLIVVKREERWYVSGEKSLAFAATSAVSSVIG